MDTKVFVKIYLANYEWIVKQNNHNSLRKIKLKQQLYESSIKDKQQSKQNSHLIDGMHVKIYTGQIIPNNLAFDHIYD